MTLKKKLTMAVALVLIIALAIAGTYAYLTSTTGTVKNTFTIGKVAIKLDEAKTDVEGVADTTADRVQGNEYKLMPGHTYAKDPTVHVLKDSEACWVFVKVVDGLAAIEDTTTIANQITANGWTALSGVNNVYYKQQDAVTADTDLVIFENFKIKTDADTSTYGDATIEITAYAIQQDGLTTAAAAWTAGGFGA